MESDRKYSAVKKHMALGGIIFACLIILFALNPYLNPLGWGYERGKELSRESYAMARYEYSKGYMFMGLYYSYLGLKASVDSEFDHMRARPLLDASERLSREGNLLEARAACLEAEQILIQYLWDYGIHSNCTY